MGDLLLLRFPSALHEVIELQTHLVPNRHPCRSLEALVSSTVITGVLRIDIGCLLFAHERTAVLHAFLIAHLGLHAADCRRWGRRVSPV